MHGQLALSRGVGMMNDLVGVGGAAIDDGAVPIGLEARGRRALGGAERGEKFCLVPRAQEQVIAPLCIRVLDTEPGKGGRLLDRRRTGDIAEAASVGATHSDIESPIGEAFVNEVVLRNENWGVPHSNGHRVRNRASSGSGRRGLDGPLLKFRIL